MLPLGALPAASSEARAQGHAPDALTHDRHPAISTECWWFGPPVTIQLTESAAAAWIQAHEDNRPSEQCDTC